MTNTKIKNIWISISEFRRLLRLEGLTEPNYDRIFRQNNSFSYIVNYLRIVFMSNITIWNNLEKLINKVENEEDLLQLISNTIVDNYKTRLIFKGMWMWYDNKKPEIDFNNSLNLLWSENLDKKYGIDGYRWNKDHYEFYQFKNKGFNQNAINKFNYYGNLLKKKCKFNFKYYLIFNTRNDVYDVDIAKIIKNF